MHILKLAATIVFANFAIGISNPVDITNLCEFKDITILSNCYWHGAMSVEELIIRNQNEFEDYGDKIINNDNRCEAANLPIIDFSEYSILSKITQDGCCSDMYTRLILKDYELKKITYKIDVEYFGSCEKLCFNYNLVLVPKIPEDYKVEFIVNGNRS